MEWFSKKAPSSLLWTEDSQGRRHLTEAGKRQFKEWEAEGKICEVCYVHILDPKDDLPRTESWQIVTGEPQKYGDIDRETYKQFKDEQGNIYAVVHYESGMPTLHFAKRDTWNYVQEKLKSI